MGNNRPDSTVDLEWPALPTPSLINIFVNLHFFLPTKSLVTPCRASRLILSWRQKILSWYNCSCSCSCKICFLSWLYLNFYICLGLCPLFQSGLSLLAEFLETIWKSSRLVQSYKSNLCFRWIKLSKYCHNSQLFNLSFII